jgi:hypothetical protein
MTDELGPASDRSAEPVQTVRSRAEALLSDRALRLALITFVVVRLFLVLWATLVLAIRPIPAEPDELLRPYLGEPILSQGAAGLLLGPWQRFDTQHYLRIAREGYADPADSVFPPLYPGAIRGLDWLLGPFIPESGRSLLGGIILSNLAFLGVLVLMAKLAEEELDVASAQRTVVYMALFPTAFFLLAAYTESNFLLFAISSIWLARRQRFWPAGVVALLASLTRLTGWVLAVPLAYELWQRRKSLFPISRQDITALAILLPLLGTVGFIVLREFLGLPSLNHVYQQYWYQRTGIPGTDLIRVIGLMIEGQASIAQYFDFFCTFLLLATTILAFKKLGTTYGLYSAALLLFMLLPSSDLKPLYSFSRYALVFFPSFMVLGQAGKNPWLHRLILYPSFGLFLFFSGQFFMWGWVA